MKKVVIALLLASSAYQSMAQVALKGYPIAAVPINKVELTDNFWLPKIKTVQQTTIPFGFDKSYKEGRMDNFLIEGASNSLISSPDKKLEVYLDLIIAIIKVGQEPDGYLTTWLTIDPNNPPAKWVKPGPRWESEIMSHELYNAGHLYEAAATHYVATNKRNFLDIALKNADLLVKTFDSEPGKRKAPPGHQVVETGLIKLNTITQKEDYLKLTKFFLDVRGDSTTHKLYGPYSIIELVLPMSIRRVVANEAVKDDKGMVSLEYGPVVYCVEGIDNQNKVADITLPDTAQLRIEKKDNLLGGVNVITGTVPLKGQPGSTINLVAIPYYTWSNRGVDPMKVWLPRSQ